MKKVLFADPTCHWGHIPYNTDLLRIFTKHCSVDVFFKKDYLDTSGLDIEQRFDSKYDLFHEQILAQGKKYLGLYFDLINLQKKIVTEIYEIAERGNYDLIFLSSIDIISFALAAKNVERKLVEKTVFIEHSLCLTTQYKFMKLYWRFVKPYMNVAIMDPSFSGYIKDGLHCDCRQYLLRHPFAANLHTSSPKKGNRRLVYAPSGSNDPSFVKSLYKLKDKIPDNVKLVAKYWLVYPGAKYDLPEYEDETLRIFSHILPRDEYEQYYADCDAVIVPYDKFFNYRMSGVIYDAIVSGKRIFLLRGNTLHNYAVRYPNIFIEFDDVADLFAKLADGVLERCDEAALSREIESFRRYSSEESIIEDITALLDGRTYEQRLDQIKF